MKLFGLTILLTMLLSLSLYSAETGRIIVNIKNFPNDKGVVRSHLFCAKNPKDFPTESDNAFKKAIAQINNGTARIVFDNVPYGAYAISAHHDANNNGAMDRNMIGYPKEGFGLSNNPRMLLPIPSFNKCKFELKSKEMEITIQLKFAK